MAGTESLPTPQDTNQNFALIGVQGTAGTADTRGTSVTMPISVDPLTGAMNVKDLSGAAGTTNVQVLGGTVNRVQTIGTLESGTVTLTNPTGTTVQFNNGTVDMLKAGTITVLENGTVDTQLQQYTNGDVNGTPKGFLAMWRQSGDNSVQAVADDNPIPTHVRLGTITKLEGGTLGNLASGTINSATVVLNSGTINVSTATVGTIPGVGVVTSVTNLASGTLLSSGTSTGMGTLTNVGTLTGAGVVTTVTNLTSGSVRMTVGTITTGTIVNSGTTTGVGVVTSITNLASGTLLSSGTTTGVGVVSSLTQGSINVTAGTVRINYQPIVVSNTYGTTTAGTIGTLVAAPSAGSAIVVTGLDVQQVSGTAETVVSWGLAANGAQVLSRGNYVAGGGISKNMVSPVSGSATGTALTFNMLSGSGTVTYVVSYFVAVP